MRRLVVLAVALAGCVPAPLPASMYTVIGGDPRRDVKTPDVGQAEWTLSRERLARMRSELPPHPYVERVRLTLIEPRTGRVYHARGAVAVSPGRAARLVLVGPGGVTALDLWITRDRFRFIAPALRLERRGGKDLSATGGLPVGFFRWWFLAPLGGELVLARSNEAETAFLFRDGAATVTLRTDGERFVGVRREGARLEGLEWTGQGLAPHPGARGHYIDGQWGMRVDVLVEDVLPDEPDPAAFEDPDESGPPP